MKIDFEGFDSVKGGVCAPKGFRAAGIHCGIRKNKEKFDLALIASDVLCNTAATYTQNKVCGSPIVVTKKNLENGKAQAVIVNSGNANTCNADGEEKAKKMCELTAAALEIKTTDVIVASTGVIGKVMPIEPIEDGMLSLVAALNENGSEDAATAIMTTDLKRKEIALTFEIDGKTCTIGGIAKGSGMIHPNMATMLCFLTTDVKISSEMLSQALIFVTDNTFNMVSVDGDTSTNDMASLMASGLAGNHEIDCEDEEYDLFVNALYVVMMNLSREIARDGEGATKLLECVVNGAKTKKDAKAIAKTIIASSLVKTAMFGADANWGRVLCAAGYADAEFNPAKVDVMFSSESGTIEVCKQGAGIDFSEFNAKKILTEGEIRILVSLGDGDGSAIAWGCDLTYDYVKINGNYRS